MKKGEITKLVKEAREALGSVSSLEAWEEIRTTFLGRKGEVAKLTKGLKDATPAQKKELGQAINKAKKDIEAALEKAKLEFGSKQQSAFDVTLPGIGPKQGSIHPLTALRFEVIDIFSSMGFDVLEGPELESDFYNFEALNIPPEHPARDMQDTFFIKGQGNLVMRTHSSNMQGRHMESRKPPFRVIVPGGRVFRNEATDASHEHTFHQLDGFVVDEGINVGHLLGTLRTFFSRLFQAELKVRLRPSYFPFVEPGYELDFSCVNCEGKGCRVCKNSGWVEILGCGMIHPNVLKAIGLGDSGLTGFAWGGGFERIAMMKYGIDDIRLFQSADMRFLKQF